MGEAKRRRKFADFLREKGITKGGLSLVAPHVRPNWPLPDDDSVDDERRMYCAIIGAINLVHEHGMPCVICKETVTMTPPLIGYVEDTTGVDLENIWTFPICSKCHAAHSRPGLDLMVIKKLGLQIDLAS